MDASRGTRVESSMITARCGFPVTTTSFLFSVTCMEKMPACPPPWGGAKLREPRFEVGTPLSSRYWDTSGDGTSSILVPSFPLLVVVRLVMVAVGLTTPALILIWLGELRFQHLLKKTKRIKNFIG